MGDSLLPMAFMLGGFGLIAAWLVCHGVAALRAWHIRRATRAIAAEVDGGGRASPTAPLVLARSYVRVRQLGILGNVLLAAGLAGLLLSHLLAGI